MLNAVYSFGKMSVNTSILMRPTNIYVYKSVKIQLHVITHPPPPPRTKILTKWRPPIQGKLAQLVERRDVNPEVAGSYPALVIFSLFIRNLPKHSVYFSFNVSFKRTSRVKRHYDCLHSLQRCVSVFRLQKFRSETISLSLLIQVIFDTFINFTQGKFNVNLWSFMFFSENTNSV